MKIIPNSYVRLTSDFQGGLSMKKTGYSPVQFNPFDKSNFNPTKLNFILKLILKIIAIWNILFKPTSVIAIKNRRVTHLTMTDLRTNIEMLDFVKEQNKAQIRFQKIIELPEYKMN